MMLLPPHILGRAHHQWRENNPMFDHRLKGNERHGIAESSIAVVHDHQDVQIRLGVVISARFGAKQHDAR